MNALFRTAVAIAFAFVLGGCAVGSAVSSLKRDAYDEIRSQCREQFVRGMEVEDLARAVVQ